MEIGGLIPGLQHDQILVGGNFALAGTLALEFIDAGAGLFMPQGGETFNLFDWGTRNGTFHSLELPLLPQLLFWDVSQLYATGELSIAAIPEGSSFWRVVVAGLLTLPAAIIRRKQQTK